MDICACALLICDEVSCAASSPAEATSWICEAVYHASGFGGKPAQKPAFLRAGDLVMILRSARSCRADGDILVMTVL